MLAAPVAAAVFIRSPRKGPLLAAGDAVGVIATEVDRHGFGGIDVIDLLDRRREPTATDIMLVNVCLAKPAEGIPQVRRSRRATGPVCLRAGCTGRR